MGSTRSHVYSGNLDSAKLSKHISQQVIIAGQRQVLAADLETQINQINVKATTTEKLGFVGRKEGIAVEAVVLLVKTA